MPLKLSSQLQQASLRDPRLLFFNHGIERESLRVTPDAHLATTPHPAFFGGKLTKKDDEEHINNNHGIVLSDDFQFSNTNSIIVNSYHNNIIEFDDLGKNLIPFAKHENDNTIEGFRHIKLPIIGVMWHPERKQDENSIKLFPVRETIAYKQNFLRNRNLFGINGRGFFFCR